jgi:hypothetical protein
MATKIGHGPKTPVALLRLVDCYVRSAAARYSI